jgi:predicted protein tyrosine phosphatase
MKFVVYSRAVMQGATPPDKPWALISICEEGSFPQVYENEYLRGRLNLQFHDIDEYKNGEPEQEDRILFNGGHAREVVDFVQRMQDDSVSVIYVHCLMGRCRSAGIAAALDKTLNGDDSKYFARGPYQPNMRVYRGVLDECHARGLI